MTDDENEMLNALGLELRRCTFSCCAKGRATADALDKLRAEHAEMSAKLPPCVTPNGRVDSHMTYVRFNGERMVCAFCGKPDTLTPTEVDSHPRKRDAHLFEVAARHPSLVGRLRWWSRELRAALKGGSDDEG